MTRGLPENMSWAARSTPAGSVCVTIVERRAGRWARVCQRTRTDFDAAMSAARAAAFARPLQPGAQTAAADAPAGVPTPPCPGRSTLSHGASHE